MLTFVLIALGVVLGRETILAFDRRRRPRRAAALDVAPEQPVAFGPGRTWLAIASDDPARVLEALALEDPVVTGWSEGLAAADETRAGAGASLFVTPPLNGWTLVVGRTLPGLRDLVPLGRRLSRALDTDVQAFQADEPHGLHGWLFVEDGELRRGYVYHRDAGKPVLEVGHATALDDDIDAPDDDDVMHVAAGASLDPTSLGVYPAIGPGWLAHWPRAARD